MTCRASSGGDDSEASQRIQDVDELRAHGTQRGGRGCDGRSLHNRRLAVKRHLVGGGLAQRGALVVAIRKLTYSHFRYSLSARAAQAKSLARVSTEEHTSKLHSLTRISYAALILQQKNIK